MPVCTVAGSIDGVCGNIDPNNPGSGVRYSLISILNSSSKDRSLRSSCMSINTSLASSNGLATPILSSICLNSLCIFSDGKYGVKISLSNLLNTLFKPLSLNSFLIASISVPNMSAALMFFNISLSVLNLALFAAINLSTTSLAVLGPPFNTDSAPPVNSALASLVPLW